MNTKQNIPQHLEKPYYTIQINSGSCNFEIRANDMPVWQYLYDDGGISINVPLNAFIIESGIQDISVKIFPRKGEEKLTKYAYLEIEVRKYNDVNDAASNFENLIDYKLDVPEEGIPLSVYKNKFKATVPYKIEAWKNSKELKDIEDIESKIISFYEMYWELLNTKNISKLNALDIKREKNIAEVFYFSKERIVQRVEFVNEAVLDKNAIMQPLQNYLFVYYAKGKVISLLLPNGEHALHSIIKEEDGDVTNTRQLQLHMPSNSDQLEII